MIILVSYFWQSIVQEHVYCAELLCDDRVAQTYYYKDRYNRMLSDRTDPLGWQLDP
jgi:hypothetical protein